MADAEPPAADAEETAPPEEPLAEALTPKRKLTFKITKGEGIKGSTEEPTTYVTYTLPGPKLEGESGETSSEKVAASSSPDYNICEELELEPNETLVTELLGGFKVTVMEFIDGKNPVHQAIGTAVLDLREMIFVFDANAEEVLSIKKQCPLDGVEGASLTVELTIDEPLVDEVESLNNNMVTINVGSAHQLPASWQPKEGETNESHTFFYSFLFNFPGFEEQQYAQSELQLASGEVMPGTEASAESAGDEQAPQVELSDEEVKAWQEKNAPAIRWQGSLSKYLTADAVASLKSQLESGGVQGELDKYLKSSNPYPYTGKYHASLKFDCSAILKQDCTKAASTAVVVYKALAEGEEPRAPPAYNDPTAAAGGKGGKAPAKGAVEFEQEEETEDPHPYEEAGTYVKIELSFVRPINPRPKTPPPPLPKPSELIARRPRVQPYREPAQATEDFALQVQEVVTALADEYAALFMRPDVASTAPEDPAVRRKQMAYHLNTSGQYFAFKEKLKKSVVRIVKERFQNDGTKKPEEMYVFYNNLYVVLMEELNKAMNRIFENFSQPVEEVDASDAKLAALRRLSIECENNHQFDLAYRYLNERITARPDSAELWCDIGMYQMRQSDYAKAAEAFKEAVSLDPDFPECLLAYGVVCLIQDSLRDAESFLTAAVQTAPDHVTANAVLGLFFLMQERRKDAKKQAKRIEEVQQRLGLDKRSIFLEAATFLLTMNATTLVERALVEDELNHGRSIDALLILAKAYTQRSMWVRAEEHIDEILSKEKKNLEALSQLGHIKFLQDCHEDAIKHYELTLKKDPHYKDVNLYLRLASMYCNKGLLQKAKANYIDACRLEPSATSWLGLGKTCLKMREFREAEEALAEANIHNNHNSEVWGCLAIACLNMNGKLGEADMAFREATKLQLSNHLILRDIGQGYLDKGKFDVAETALRQSDAACRLPVIGLSGHAIKPRPDVLTYLALAEALKQQNKLQEAIEWNEKAKMFASSDQKDLAIRAMQQLHGLTEALGYRGKQTEWAQMLQAEGQVPMPASDLGIIRF